MRSGWQSEWLSEGWGPASVGCFGYLDMQLTQAEERRQTEHELSLSCKEGC